MLLSTINEGFSADSVRMLAAYAISLLFAIGLHEYAHARMAVWCGDPTPEKEGRLTLNPLAHLDPFGTVMILLAGFGWGKPVMVNSYNFRKGRRDWMLVAAAGPFANFLMAGLGTGLVWVLWIATVGLLGVRQETAGPPEWVLTLFLLLHVFVALNLALMLFNLIPVGPLDGVKVLQYFLPRRAAERFWAFSMQYGGLLLIGLVIVMSRTPLLDFLYVPLDAFFDLVWPY